MKEITDFNKKYNGIGLLFWKKSSRHCSMCRIFGNEYVITHVLRSSGWLSGYGKNKFSIPDISNKCRLFLLDENEVMSHYVLENI